MPRPTRPASMWRRRMLLPVLVIVAVAGFAMTAIAASHSFTLKVAKNATVKDTAGNVKHESIAVNSHGFAVYALSGDSKKHPECVASNQCFRFWPPVTVASAKKLSKDPAIKGKLSTWKRNGFTQVVLGGHPLYTFSLDNQRHSASGEGVVSFGGTWHVVVVTAPKQAAPKSPPTTTGMNPNPNPYPYTY